MVSRTTHPPPSSTALGNLMNPESFQILLGVACLLIGFGIGYVARWWPHRHDIKRAADQAWRMSEIRNRRSEQP